MHLSWSNSLIGRTLFLIAFAIGITVLVFTGISYFAIFRSLEQKDVQQLTRYTTERARNEEMVFLLAEENHRVLKKVLLDRLKTPGIMDVDHCFDELVEKTSDGAMRSRREEGDAAERTTTWIHSKTQVTTDLKRLILVLHELCDQFSPAWRSRFQNLYISSPLLFYTGLDPTLPNWVWEVAPDYDQNSAEWVNIAATENNPRRQLVCSGVRLHPLTRAPIVTVSTPVDIDGRHLLTLHHDIALRDLIEDLFHTEREGMRHLIFSEDGRLIAHPHKEEELINSRGSYLIQNSPDKRLKSVYQAVLAKAGNQTSGYNSMTGDYYAASKLANSGWYFVTTMPRSLLREKAFESAKWVLWTGMASLAFILLLLAAILRHHIARPLAQLLSATQGLGSGGSSQRLHINSRDELGQLASAFNDLIGRIEDRDQALQQEKANLERRVEDRTAELAASEARYRTMVENAPEAIVVLDSDTGRFVEANENAARLFGYSREELFVLGVNDLSQPTQTGGLSSEALAKAKLQEALDGGTPIFAWSYLTASGHHIIGETRLVRLPAAGRRLVRGSITDITERRRIDAALRESENRYRSLFENTSAPVAVHDEHAFLQVNPSAMRLFGIAYREQIIGKHPKHFAPPAQDNGENSEAACRRHMDAALADGYYRYEWSARKLDGRIITLDITLTTLMLHGRKVLQAVMNDITDQKRAEEELLKALAREKELGELKSSFVSTVSHEFRTPLGVIMSSGEILQRYFDRLKPEQRDRHLHAIHRSVLRMDQMMDEVLLLGKAEAGKMEYKPVPLDLAAFCKRTVDEILSATSHQNPIDLEMDAFSQTAWADESILRHIFTNLLSNAVKYSSNGQPVLFSIRQENTAAIFEIQDKGLGIPAQDLERLFQAFHRGRNATHLQGTGLGLAIVKRCVELQNGKIRCQSEEGQGTTFTVTLPLFPK